MVNEIFKDMKERMDKAVQHYKAELVTIRTGRANPGMLDSIKVDYYGVMSPLNNLSHVSVPEPQLIVIQPFDPSTLEAIEKAIVGSDIGLNPNNDGNVIRLSVPTLTEERRVELVKNVHKIIEDGRVSIRNIRRDSNNALKELEKSNELSEDNLKRALDNVQESTDEYIKIFNDMQDNKEKEIME